MPIAEPTDALGLWPRVRAGSGWPETNEDSMRALADGWRSANSLFTTAGARTVNAGAWTDDAGAAFATRARGTLDMATAHGADMARLAARADGFAGEVAGVKTGINRLIDANLVPYAALWLLPAGVRAAAEGVFVQQLAGAVNGMLTDAAGRVAQAPAAPRTAAEKDRANRARMAADKAALRAELADLERRIAASPRGPGNATEVGKLFDRKAEIERELGGIATLEGRFARQGPTTPENQRYYLLDYDLNGAGADATAVVAVGNPDTAPNVATYVPGAESSFGQMGRLMRETDAMKGAAGGGSSVIMWLGYDAPPNVADAADPSYARQGQQALADFQRDLRASHVGPPSHNTVVGHSYGSVVAGFAARDQTLPVDDFVAVGSPGTGVRTAADLHLPPANVYVIEDNQDPVADVGGTGWYGTDPGDPAFDGQQLWSDREPPRASSPLEYTADSHLAYFDTGRDNPALTNIGDVIAGRPPSVR